MSSYFAHCRCSTDHVNSVLRLMSTSMLPNFLKIIDGLTAVLWVATIFLYQSSKNVYCRRIHKLQYICTTFYCYLRMTLHFLSATSSVLMFDLFNINLIIRTTTRNLVILNFSAIYLNKLHDGLQHIPFCK